VSHGGVMEILGREYRERKEMKGVQNGKKTDLETIVRVMEVITLDD
jgi:hypothetical protein